MPFRSAVAVMPFWCDVRLYGGWACQIANSPACQVGWPASYPRFRVGGAPGLAATETMKIELDPSLTDERKSNAGKPAYAHTARQLTLCKLIR